MMKEIPTYWAIIGIVIAFIISFFIGGEIAKRNIIQLSGIQILFLFILGLFLIVIGIIYELTRRKVKKK